MLFRSLVVAEGAAGDGTSKMMLTPDRVLLEGTAGQIGAMEDVMFSNGSECAMDG